MCALFMHRDVSMYEYPFLGRRHISRTHVYYGPIGQIWPLYRQKNRILFLFLSVSLFVTMPIFGQCFNLCVMWVPI